jgi:hypothetical protein
MDRIVRRGTPGGAFVWVRSQSDAHLITLVLRQDDILLGELERTLLA